jgi:peroxiredoxin Q/BCP
MLKVNDPAPAFTLKDHQGRDVALADLLATGPVLLYFYPADFTPVCTKEACMFRDRTADLASRGVHVVGISPQSTSSKSRFAAAKGLTQILLADDSRTVARAYDATALLGLVIRRVTYLIDRDARIADVALADLSLGAHEALIERVLARYPSRA